MKIFNRLKDWLKGVPSQEELVRQAASSEHSIARPAIDMMRQKGWLEGQNGLLKGRNLSGAFLRGANFGSNANLSSANFEKADMILVYMPQVNLKEASLLETKLLYAYLENAYLWGAKLVNADLEGVELISANLSFCDLRGANLKNANLPGIYLSGAIFDDNTILPDGTNWTAGADMEKFTNPNHPEYTLYRKRENLILALEAVDRHLS